MKAWKEMDEGSYVTHPLTYLNEVPSAMWVEKPQSIFVFETEDHKARFYVNTPQIDPPSYYAVFESTVYHRDNFLHCTSEDTHFKDYIYWPWQMPI